jgi:hypothetical protein
MVLIVVAAATIISWSTLSSTALRVDATANRARAARAEQLSHSALTVALHYLRHPELSPADTVLGQDGPYSPSHTYAVNGCDVSVTVTPSGNGYQVDVVVEADALVRKSGARVVRETALQPPGIFSIDGDGLLPTAFVGGDIVASGDIGPPPPAHTAGFASATGTNYGGDPAPSSDVVPAPGEIPLFTQNAYPGGNAVELNGLTGTHDARTATNPLGIIRIDRKVQQREPLHLTGTLIINDELHLRAPIHITAEPGMPALVVRDKMHVHKGADAFLQGAFYVGEKLDTHGNAGTATDINVEGPVLMNDFEMDAFDGRLTISPARPLELQNLAPGRESVTGLVVTDRY